MVNILLGLLKGLLGMKFGWLIAIVIGIVLGGSIIKNIFTGSFSVGKFLGGFNIFAGGVQGKLIYYGIIFAIVAAVVYQIIKPTYSYDTDYKNHIHNNEDVFLDQRVGTQEGCAFEFGFGLIKLGCKSKPMSKTVSYDCQKCKEVKK